MVAAESSRRYERKFLVDQLDALQVRALVRLHPSLFVETYPPRYVNNIYLDTVELDNYYDNVAGAPDRRKVRVRWYGELFGPVAKPALEFKTKHGLVGTKEQYPLASWVLDETFSVRGLQGIFRQSDLSPALRHYLADLQPVLLNRYFRRYYATTDGCYRLTIDSEMLFHNVRRLRNTFLGRQELHCQVVLEIKYQDAAERHADRVAGYFPFPVTRNSKYVQGIEAVYL